jgi:hypothetical protein
LIHPGPRSTPLTKENVMTNNKKAKKGTLRPWLVDVVVDTLR